MNKEIKIPDVVYGWIAGLLLGLVVTGVLAIPFAYIAGFSNDYQAYKNFPLQVVGIGCCIVPASVYFWAENSARASLGYLIPSFLDI